LGSRERKRNWGRRRKKYETIKGTKEGEKERRKEKKTREK
jgi:hypothetical protein